MNKSQRREPAPSRNETRGGADGNKLLWGPFEWPRKGRSSAAAAANYGGAIKANSSWRHGNEMDGRGDIDY